MSAGDRDNLSPGAAEVRDRFAADFQHTPWGRPDVRKRWIPRQHNETSVRKVSDALAWNVAVSLDRILPTEILGPVVEGAMLNNFAEAVEVDGDVAEPGEEKAVKDWWHLYLAPPVVAAVRDAFLGQGVYRWGRLMCEPGFRWRCGRHRRRRSLR
ncbi:hypothetical protein ACFRQM_44520 [Streptomyces sp. NPDC056831]|uniref:hypothetical protein n=1 Tax=Streptomyces sp. NPDC056831 TaxID=3345954 RepID=UPI003684C989